MKEKILVVDDDRTIRATFESLLLEEGYGVATAEDYHEALTRLDETDFDLIFADIFLGNKTGIDLLREVRKMGLSTPVMVVQDETRLVCLERDLRERQQFHRIVGKSEKMQRIYSLIEDLADAPATVLITGESGTGKELVAEALHYKGGRSHKPLVKVNCSALSENLLESELFGHVKGAFTGAVKDRVGRFQRAHGGTLFLDEIGEISPRIQLRLLRVLQEKELERVGDSTPIQVDVRVVAATNRDLREKVRSGELREDLYYRLNVVEVSLPPLRSNGRTSRSWWTTS